MVFGESPLKDAYRLFMWGPWRKAVEHAAPGAEVRAHRILGRVAYRVSDSRRKLVCKHLRNAFGDQPDLSLTAQRVFETHFANQYIGFAWHRISRETIGHYVELRNEETLTEAQRGGRGAIVAHPHMGLPQIPLHALGLRGVDVHQVGGGRTAVELSSVGQWSAGVRASLEGAIRAQLHDGTRYLRPVMRALKDNGVVFSACDGTGGGDELGRRATVSVLGRAMAIPVFPAWLSERCNTPVLFLKIYRNPGPGALYIGEFHGPVRASGLAAKTAEIGEHLDSALRAHPGEWHFWDQWHSGPGGLLR